MAAVNKSGQYLDTGAPTRVRSALSTIQDVMSAQSRQPKQGSVQIENTYRLEPESRFPVGRIKQVIKDHLQQELQDYKYNAEECSQMSSRISESLKQEAKNALNCPRYKVVSFVVIGQKQTGVQCVSRCVWNDKTDSVAEEHFANDSVYAVALVYGIYLD